MFQRTLRRSNYIFNNTNLSFPSKAFPINRTNPCKDEPPKTLLYLKKDLKTIPVDPNWKIKELVKRELEKEGVGGGGGSRGGSRGRIFRGLVGILFFILFLYERRII